MNRITGKHFAPVFVGLMVVVSAIALWRRSENSGGAQETIASRTLEDGTTLKVLQGDGETFEAYLALVDDDGQTRWRKGIYKLVDPSLRGMTVDEKMVTIRAADTRGNYETHAFGRADGAFLWRGGRIKQAAPVGKPTKRSGDRVVEYYGPPVNEQLELSAINGDILSRKPWSAP